MTPAVPDAVPLTKMFDFAWPWLIALLPLPVLVGAVTFLLPRPRRADVPELLFPHVGRLKTAFSKQDEGPGRVRWFYYLNLGMAWICLVGALMQPELADSYTQTRTSGHDIMLVVDLSGSMRALDLGSVMHRVSRVDVVKGVVRQFAQERQGDRLGLVLFGEHAYLDVPLTYDTAAVAKMLDNAEAGEAGDSTAIGDALGVAVKRIIPNAPPSIW